MHVYRLQRVLAALAMLPAVAGAQVPAAPAAQEPTLHAMVDNAVRRSPLARTLEARLDEGRAARDLAASWLAGPAVLGLAQRSGRWTGQPDKRESELSISAPLWLPGQQSARAALADAGAEELAAQQALVRLEVAGQVRRALWEAAAAYAAQAEKEDHLRHLEDLAADVQRRVDAGDLARSDGLLAQQEVLAARNDVAAARMRAGEARIRFKALTGLQPPAYPGLEAITQDAAPAALRVQAAHATEQRARAAVAAATAQPGAAPVVALSVRQERAGNVALADRDRSIGIALHIPLNGRLRNRPAESAAATQLATASAERAQAEAEADGALDLARTQLAHTRQSLRTAEQRAAVMHEHTRLIAAAFQAGERSLAELLRSRALTHEAQVAVRQQQVALGHAHASFNQALGVLP